MGLEATDKILNGQAVIEYRGKVMLRQHYDKENVFFKRLHPFVMFYSQIENFDLCIDASSYGNDARFVRRSCFPNAEVRHFVEHGDIHFMIYSKKDISKGTEITIPFDYNYQDCSFCVECACLRSNCPVSKFWKKMKNAQNKIVTRKPRTRKQSGSAQEKKNALRKPSSRQSPIRLSIELTDSVPTKEETVNEVVPPETNEPAKELDEPTKLPPPDEVPDVQVKEEPPASPPKSEESEKKQLEDSEDQLPSGTDSLPQGGGSSEMEETGGSDAQRKMTREERKMEAIMKAFEKLEKRQERRKEALARIENAKKTHDPKPKKQVSEEVPTEVVEMPKQPTPTESKPETPQKISKGKKGRKQPRRRSRVNSTSALEPVISNDESSNASTSVPSAPTTPVPVPLSVTGVTNADLLPVNDAGFKFIKTKKHLFNEWLSEKSQDGKPAMVGKTEPLEVSVDETVFVTCLPSPRNAMEHLQRRNSHSAGRSVDSSIGSAKKRWLRQAMSTDSGSTSPGHGGSSPNLTVGLHSPGSSPPTDFVTPLKKRRLARESLSQEQPFTPTPSTLSPSVLQAVGPDFPSSSNVTLPSISDLEGLQNKNGFRSLAHISTEGRSDAEINTDIDMVERKEEGLRESLDLESDTSECNPAGGVVLFEQEELSMDSVDTSRLAVSEEQDCVELAESTNDLTVDSNMKDLETSDNKYAEVTEVAECSMNNVVDAKQEETADSENGPVEEKTSNDSQNMDVEETESSDLPGQSITSSVDVPENAECVCSSFGENSKEMAGCDNCDECHTLEKLVDRTSLKDEPVVDRNQECTVTSCSRDGIHDLETSVISSTRATDNMESVTSAGSDCSTFSVIESGECDSSIPCETRTWENTNIEERVASVSQKTFTARWEDECRVDSTTHSSDNMDSSAGSADVYRSPRIPPSESSNDRGIVNSASVGETSQDSSIATSESSSSVHTLSPTTLPSSSNGKLGNSQDSAEVLEIPFDQHQSTAPRTTKRKVSLLEYRKRLKEKGKDGTSNCPSTPTNKSTASSTTAGSTTPDQVPTLAPLPLFKPASPIRTKLGAKGAVTSPFGKCQQTEDRRREKPMSLSERLRLEFGLEDSEEEDKGNKSDNEADSCQANLGIPPPPPTAPYPGHLTAARNPVAATTPTSTSRIPSLMSLQTFPTRNLHNQVASPAAHAPGAASHSVRLPASANSTSPMLQPSSTPHIGYQAPPSQSHLGQSGAAAYSPKPPPPPPGNPSFPISAVPPTTPPFQRAPSPSNFGATRTPNAQQQPIQYVAQVQTHASVHVGQQYTSNAPVAVPQSSPTSQAQWTHSSQGQFTPTIQQSHGPPPSQLSYQGHVRGGQGKGYKNSNGGNHF